MALVTSSAPPTLAADLAQRGPLAPPPIVRPGRPIPAHRAVAAVDVALVSVVLVAALAPPSSSWPATLQGALTARVHVYDTLLLVAFAAIALFLFDRLGLYDAALVRRFHRELGRVLLGTAILSVAAALAVAVSHGRPVEAPVAGWFWAWSFPAVGAARLLRSHLGRRLDYVRVLVVGSGPHALRLCRDLSADPRTRYQVLGFVDSEERTSSAFVRRRILGPFDALETLLAREHVDEVYVGLPVRSHYPQIQETIRVCERIGVKVTYAADIFGVALARPRLRATAQRPQVELRLVADGWPVAAKRAADVALAGAALVLLAPLFALAALAVRLSSPGPVIYGQERYGLNRRRFRMLKFRTMVADADRLQAALEGLNEAHGPVFKIRNDPRITAVGRWLRRTSIDELPQLVNVLRGDMSLVGPRPLPLRDVGRFTRSADLRRFSVRPGITGLWQVSGRSSLSFDDWIALDLHYIDRWSLALDIRILLRTIPAVVRGTGAA
jgi:exopolysaccharide biosynthesis polyprenyl glycosylphosphotransferase